MDFKGNVKTQFNLQYTERRTTLDEKKRVDEFINKMLKQAEKKAKK